jgi:heme-degrading monooxygenase HmoA
VQDGERNGLLEFSHIVKTIDDGKDTKMSKVAYIQVINFNLEGITRDDFMGVADEVAPNFAQLPGLISKAFLSDEASNTYGGVYYWESQKDCEAYRASELYAQALANNPNFTNLSDKGFDVLEGPSQVTRL